MYCENSVGIWVEVVGRIGRYGDGKWCCVDVGGDGERAGSAPPVRPTNGPRRNAALPVFWFAEVKDKG